MTVKGTKEVALFMTEEVSKEQIKGENGTGIDEVKRLKGKREPTW